MPGFRTGGFEIGNVLDARTYPAARRGAARNGPAPTAGVGPDTPGPARYPRSIGFPFSVRVAGASQRSSTSSRRLLGPAIIKGLHVTKNGAAIGQLGFGLGKATNAISEQDVAATTVLPFAPLWAGLPRIGTGPTSPNQTDVAVDAQAALLVDDDSINIIVTDAEFFLVVYAASDAGGAGAAIIGHVNVIEQVDPQALAFFTG